MTTSSKPSGSSNRGHRRSLSESTLLRDIQAFYAAREILFNWVRREFKVRYSQSLLGIAWAIIQPLSMMIIFTLIFSVILSIRTGQTPYPLFSYLGLLVWTFFSSAISQSVSSLTNNINLVGKIYFPREVLPLAFIVVSFVDFLIASLIFVGMMFFYAVPVTWSIAWLPLVIVVQILFTIPICLYCAAFNIYYRDIKLLIPLVLQIMMYLTPIFYSAELIPEAYRWLFLLNPIATIIESYRALILQSGPMPWRYFAITTIISMALLWMAYRYFKRAERTFADWI